MKTLLAGLGLILLSTAFSWAQTTNTEGVLQTITYVDVAPSNLPPNNAFVLWQDFETAWTASNTPAGGFPASGWSKAILSNNTDWVRATNGISGNPPRKRFGAWTNPATGTYSNFARFGAASYGNVTRLHSPPINLTSFGTNAPTLSFYHIQVPWPADQDYLWVMVNTNFDSAAATSRLARVGGHGWQLLTNYSVGSTQWIQRVIALTNQLTTNMVFGFEGLGEYAYGTCIDDLIVYGNTNIFSHSYVTVTSLWQDFETAWTASNTPAGGFPASGWSKAILSNNTDWVRATNGISGNPPRARTNAEGKVAAWTNPVTGTYSNFARFGAASYGNVTRLQTPPMDLSWAAANSVTLSFHHVQVPWPADQDFLWVMVNTNFSSESATSRLARVGGHGWQVLAYYNTAQNTWTQRLLTLTNQLTTNMVFGFEGVGEYAYGTCIDDVRVTGLSPSAPIAYREVTNLWQDFETAWTASNTPAGGFPASGWSKAILSNNTDWVRATNGINGNPPRARTNAEGKVAAWTNPVTGTYSNFARFGAASYGNVTRLFTPSIELSASAFTPTMSFWHVQVAWPADQDYLYVMASTNFDGSSLARTGGVPRTAGATSRYWKCLAVYTANVSNWTERTIALTNFGTNMVICFEGVGEYAYGIGIDDLKILSMSPDSSSLVVLLNFSLRQENGQVMVCWETASEENSVGFDLFREQNGEWVKVNESLIYARDPMGSSYCLADPGANAQDEFRYKLVEIETDGTAQEYGPFDRAVWTPQMENLVATPDGVLIRWLSRDGEIYEVRKTTSLMLPLVPIAEGLIATPPVNEYVDPNRESGSAFYQIQAE